jgi:hypothetical protein
MIQEAKTQKKKEYRDSVHTHCEQGNKRIRYQNSEEEDSKEQR